MYLRDSINIGNVFWLSGNGYQEKNIKNGTVWLSVQILRMNCSVLFFFYDKHLSVDSTENIMSIECPHFIFPVLKHSGLSVNRDKM